MAAYASTVTIYTPKAERISRNLGMIAGKINITNYNATTTEETGITKYFLPSAVTGLEKGIVSFAVTHVENPYVFTFNGSTGKFKVYSQSGSAAIDDISIADTAVTIAALSVAALTSIASFASANEALKAAISANGIKIRSAAKVGLDAAVSATIVKIESAVNALTTTGTMAEVADNTDVGECGFTVVGFIR